MTTECGTWMKPLFRVSLEKEPKDLALHKLIMGRFVSSSLDSIGLALKTLEKSFPSDRSVSRELGLFEEIQEYK